MKKNIVLLALLALSYTYAQQNSYVPSTEVTLDIPLNFPV